MANSKTNLEGDETRLDSWGEIAAYIRRDLSTAMRWEKKRGLPVHRVPGGERGTVYAFRHEIDAWLANGSNAGAGGWELGAAERQESGAKGDAGIRDSEFKIQETKDKGQRAEAGIRDSEFKIQKEEDAELGAGEDGSQIYEQPTSVNPAAALPRPRRQILGYLITAACVAVVVALVYAVALPPAAPRIVGTTKITDDGWTKGGVLATDGVNLYFSELTASGWTIAKVPTSGGIPTTISSSFESPQIDGISQSRGEILILDPFLPNEPRPLWVQPTSGSPRRRVGDIRADSASWGPDGESIYYSAGRNLFKCNVDGSESRRVAPLPGNSGFSRWSPDGKTIRFSIDVPGRASEQIWEMKPNGSDAHRLLPDSGQAEIQTMGAWTRDGRYFLFARGMPRPLQLWTLRDEHGLWGSGYSRPSQLSFGTENIGGWASSPDGRRIFVLSVEARDVLYRYLESEKLFVPYLSSISGNEVNFSPDGQWITYMGMRDYALWKGKLDGSQTTQLTFSMYQAELPRWSPDGKWIAFMGLKSLDDIWRVYMIPSEGGEPRVVLSSTIAQGAPTWSPDGKRLAFGELPNSEGGAATSPVIHIVNLTTNEATTLPGSTGLWTARWSPDGRHMAALSSDSKSIKVFDFLTGRWQDLAAATSISDLVWSRDSRAIYFQDEPPTKGPTIYRVTLGNQSVEEVANLKGKLPASSNWLGIAPDGSLLVTDAAGTSEIYALDVNWP